MVSGVTRSRSGLVGDYFDDTLCGTQGTYCAEAGGHFLSPFDDEDVIEGQASVGVEIEDQMGAAGPDHPAGGAVAACPQVWAELVRPVDALHLRGSPLGGARLTGALGGRASRLKLDR